MRVQKSLLIITFVCIGLLAGVLNTLFGLVVLPLFVAAGIFLLIRFRKSALLFVALFAAAYSAGMARAAPFMNDWTYIQQNYGEEVVILGKIIDDPSYHQSGQKEFHLSGITLLEPEKKNIKGDVRIRSFGANNLRRGDKIEASGKVYKALGNRHGSIQYAEIEQISTSSDWLESARLKFFASTYSVLPDPESSLGLGFLVGLRNLLPDDLNENLRTTGLTHIVAVSGYNLTILVFLTRRLFAGRSKFIATFAAASLVITFLAVTGGAPSIVRASIVAGLSLAAWYVGRSPNPLILLLLSAAISAYLNPYYLWRDIGWYLSFTAFFGVLVLAPLIVKRFFRTQPKIIGQLLVETSCAQLMTLPIIAMIFGNVSVISIVANLVVLPFIPLAMATTFIAGFAGIFSLEIAFWLATPARLVLSYITSASSYLAQVPWAQKEVNFTVANTVFAYAVIASLCWLLFLVNKRRSYHIELDTLY